MKKLILIIAPVVFLIILFSYKLLEVPRGLTLDEAAFGYNAALLAKTGRDENHRLMPLFVLSSSGTDWRQPVTQYYLTFLFKVFGPSLFLLRFSSVLVVVGSIAGLYLLAKDILGRQGASIAAVVMATTPLVMIQSHMALDNIMPIPFTLIWLWGAWRFLKDKSNKYIILMGAVLGLSMYTYKGMRAIVPVWLLISGVLVAIKTKWRTVLRRWVYLGMAAGPFFLIIPWIDRHYAGAMMGGAKAVFNNVYELLSPYLSSFDVSYWFVSGDLVTIHSTMMHGMYLLASAPWFFMGIYLALRKKHNFFYFLLAAFFFGPLLFGLVGSVHRFSRLMMMIPIYSIFVGLSVSWVWKKKGVLGKMAVILGIFIAGLNYGDFLKYYWKTYPGITESYTGVFTYRKDFQELDKVSKSNDLTPVISEQVALSTGESGKFFQMQYFGRLLEVIKDGTPPGKTEVLLSTEDKIVGADFVSRNELFKIHTSSSLINK